MYQKHYWKSHKFKDRVIATRRAKAARIVEVLRQEAVDLSCSRILDVGCSVGLITEYLSHAGAEVIGLDIDIQALHLAKKTGRAFVAADAAFPPFRDEVFDAIICHQVLEHVSQQASMIGEIRRVLRTGGVCYMATVNRFRLIEPHYGLPFLSILPTRLASIYLRIAGRGGHYYERPLDYFQMRRLTSGFRVEDYTIAVLKNPSKYNIQYEVGKRTLRIVGVIPSSVLARFLFLSPGWVLILKKT